MSEVVVVARLQAKPGKEEATERALLDLVAPTHAESGCALYALHRSLDAPGVFFFVERWESRDLLDAHLANDHLVDFMGKVDDLLALPPDINVVGALPAGESGKGRLS